MFYQRHLFFCDNRRDGGKKCCHQGQADEYFAYAKDRLVALGQFGPGKLRLSLSGCMGRCKLGPVLVVYPDAVWYTYQSQADIDEIIDGHLLAGEVVQRLLLPDQSPDPVSAQVESSA